MSTKYQKIWDILLDSISKLEELEQDKETPTALLVKTRKVTKMQRAFLHSIGYRKKHHERNVIAQSIIPQTKVLPTEEQANRAAPKYKGRLTAQHGSDIKRLEAEQLPVAVISDRLMIDEDKIKSYLKKLKKDRQPKNLIHVTNGKKD
jgi:hypothetical protein